MIDRFPEFRVKLDRLKELHGEPVYLRMDKNGAGDIGTDEKVFVAFAVEKNRRSTDAILDTCIERAVAGQEKSTVKS